MLNASYTNFLIPSVYDFSVYSLLIKDTVSEH